MSELAAVINCGSHTIRVVVAQIDETGRLDIVDSAIQYTGLGRDVFSNGMIRRTTINEAIGVFQKYKELLTGWGITPQETRVIGTSAVREAKNRDTFVDRLEVRTGFQIKIMDGIEENRLTYLSVQHALKERLSQIAKVNSTIIEVGAGSTEIMLLRRGLITAVHSLSFGAVRVDERFKERNNTSMGISSATLAQNLRPMKELLASELKTSSIREFIAVGNYAQIAAQILGQRVNEFCFSIHRKDWDALAIKVHKMSPDACAREYGISILALPGLSSALNAYSLFMVGTNVEEILVPSGGNAEGALVEMGPGIDEEVRERFNLQVISSAVSLGKKYHYDHSHSQKVMELALALFDQLEKEHQMGKKERLLLQVAAILHDIGTYIKPSGHHKHGMYLVNNSEIFGLSPNDVKMVANVVRYHRKSMPNSSHSPYISLARGDRIKVLKMSAILRVADAMDRGHTQKVTQVEVNRKDEELLLKTDYTGDLSAERFSLAEKGSMFEEVFGLKVVLL